ncbi:hypothetical protein OAA86_08480 [Rhodospirillales bacterium]|nr:hypothetical protein [Rhodospirillales bacterium]
MENQKDEQENTSSKSTPDWIKKHGTKFISEVLWELGHPSEPKETLIEVLNNVSEALNTFIMDCDDASHHVQIISELNYQNEMILMERRLRHIEARDSRSSCEKIKAPWQK